MVNVWGGTEWGTLNCSGLSYLSKFFMMAKEEEDAFSFGQKLFLEMCTGC